MPKTSKISILSKKIEECGKDFKQLYKLITELTGGLKENPFPVYIDDDSLASKFAVYS